MDEAMLKGTKNAEDLSTINEKMDEEEESSKNGGTIELPLRKCLHSRFVENFSQLVDLSLPGCNLNCIPKSFMTLRLLSYLNLDDNGIVDLIPICGLINLKQLSLRKNFIRTIPGNFDDLTKLEVLLLSKNELSNLPASCSNLNNLEVLCLRNNWFQTIPVCVRDGMKRLKTLIVLGNWIHDVNVHPASIQMTSFHVDSNYRSTTFPMWILSSKYEYLETVSLNKIQLRSSNSQWPTEVSYVKSLSIKRCTFADDDIKRIISRMVHLEEFLMENINFVYDSSSITSLFESIKNLSSLRQLTMLYTQLITIPDCIKEFENLSSLVLDNNGIYNLPEEICRLHNLVCLSIDYNRLTSLPTNIGDLTSLRTLNLRHNKLDKLPESFRFLKSLEHLDLYDNDLNHIPEAICDLTELIGLDLEQNYFSIDDDYCWLGRMGCYKHMRDALRKSRSDIVDYHFESLCGPKIQSEETKSSQSSYCHDDLISLSETESPTENETNYDENDNWESEDSANEFDPYETKEPKECKYSPYTFYSPFQQVYCPGDFHEISVIQRVKEMLQNGTLIRSMEYEEGQFEDP